MLVLTGPSASGKTEIVKILIAKYHLNKFVTYTTRPMRVGEVNGIDYHFITTNEFLIMKDNNEFIETTYYNNNYYGSRIKDVDFNKVVILDPSGVNAFYQAIGEEIIAMFLDTPEEIRKIRMIERGDNLGIIEKRILSDRQTFKKENYLHLDFSFKNLDIDLESLADQIYQTYLANSKPINKGA